MSVECTLKIGCLNYGNYNRAAFLKVIAEIWLGNQVANTHLEQLNKAGEGPAVYIYGLGNENRITKDAYGKTLIALDPYMVVDALTLDVREKKNSRYYKAAIALIKGLDKIMDVKKGDDLLVVAMYWH